MKYTKEEELEKGVWYKCLRKIESDNHKSVAFLCYQGEYNGTVHPDNKGWGYGFNYRGEWNEETILFERVKATKEEREPLLIAEAKKRGLVEGVEVECSLDNESYKINKNYGYMYQIEHDDFWFEDECGKYEAVRIYSNGKWATPITSEEMTVAQIEKELGRKIKIVK